MLIGSGYFSNTGCGEWVRKSIKWVIMSYEYKNMVYLFLEHDLCLFLSFEAVTCKAFVSFWNLFFDKDRQ